MAGGPVRRHWSLASTTRGTSVQRKCGCIGSGGAEQECEQCKQQKEENALRRKAAGPAETPFAPPIVHEVLSSPGRPLDRATRDYFEPRFGRSFVDVRVHTDVKAAESADAVNALAYSVGQSIVFARGEYATAANAGRRLLAHELAHTIQQGGTGGLTPRIQRACPTVPSGLGNTPSAEGCLSAGPEAVGGSDLLFCQDSTELTAGQAR